LSLKKRSSLGATGQGGLKPFVDYLKSKLHLPFILKGFGNKLWGYKLSSLVLVLLCRPQMGAGSIAALKEKLLGRFISRLFYIHCEAKVTNQKARRKASVDILYDLFAKLDPKRIRKSMNNHLKRMRREGKVKKKLDLVIDSFIIELSVKSLKKSRFEKIGGRKIRDKFYKGFKVFVAIDLDTKALLFIEFCRIGEDDSKKLIPIIKAVRKLGFHVRNAIFDRGFWSGENFKFLQRKKIHFYTVLKEYTDEFKALVRSVNSRTIGRRRLRQGVWVTEVTPISLKKYLKTKQLRCFVMRMKGKKPWAVITNDETADSCWAASFYLRRNKVEKAIQELIDDYAIGKLPREAFDENACFVYLTAWSYNLFLDFKMEMFGVDATKTLRKKLSTLRRQILDVEAIVRYVRKTMILEFENPPPLMEELVSALG
jgi:hypothetical protein